MLDVLASQTSAMRNGLLDALHAFISSLFFLQVSAFYYQLLYDGSLLIFYDKPLMKYAFFMFQQKKLRKMAHFHFNLSKKHIYSICSYVCLLGVPSRMWHTLQFTQKFGHLSMLCFQKIRKFEFQLKYYNLELILLITCWNRHISCICPVILEDA